MNLIPIFETSLLRILDKKENIIENQETAIFKVYAPIFEAGLVGKYNVRGVENASVYYPQTTVEKMYNSIILNDTPVDLDHNNNIIGKVIDKFKNDNGYITATGKKVEPDHLYHVEMEVELPRNFDFNNASLSVENTIEDIEEVEGGEINNIKADFILKDSKIKFISIITDKNNARLTQTQRLYNSIEKNNSVLLDNKENNINESFIDQIDMTPEEKESFKNEIVEVVKNAMASMKNECSNKEEVQNMECKKEEDKPEDLKNMEGEDMSIKLDNIMSILKEISEKLNSETVENAEPEKEEDKSKEKESLQNSIKESEIEKTIKFLRS